MKITVKRSHGVGTKTWWIATLHDSNSGNSRYGLSDSLAEANLRAAYPECEGIEAEVSNAPLKMLTTETVGHGRYERTAWRTI